MALRVKLQDIVGEMELVNDQFQIYLNTETGELVIMSQAELAGAEAGDELDADSDWELEALQVAQNIVSNCVMRSHSSPPRFAVSFGKTVPFNKAPFS